MSLSKYSEITKEIEKRIVVIIGEGKNDFTKNDTICRQVSNRDAELRKFSSEKDIVLFVSGRKSSNGKFLYTVCKQTNERTYFISDTNDINQNWFVNVDKVGICGATSTPMLLMEKVKNYIDEKFS